MKKIYQISIIACMLYALMAFASCISCGDDNGDYQQACEEGDFVKAYQCARSDEAERYVILHEAMYVLEQGEESSLMKIAFIAKEHKANWLFGELEDVAHQMGDEELAQKLSSMNPMKLRLASPSIEGPLNGYFEVQDSIVTIVKEKEYGDWEESEDWGIRTTIKKIKAGKLTIPKYHDGSPKASVLFHLLILNSDGATMYKLWSNNEFFSDLEKMNVGDVTTVRFEVEEEYISGLYKYKIGCEY